MDAAGTGFDVFVSYAHENQQTADEIVAELERRGIRCWYAPRNVPVGVGYAGAIKRAIRETKVFLLLFTPEANVSKAVLNEVDIAFNEGKDILPLRLSNQRMNPDLRYYIGRAHWIEAVNQPLGDVLPVLEGKVAAKLGIRLVTAVAPTPKPKKPLGTLSKQKLHSWAHPQTVEELIFLNTLAHAPDWAEDLSEEGDRSVLGWMQGSTLYIAGEGGVMAPKNCRELFSYEGYWTEEKQSQCWDKMRAVNGGAYFNTSNVTNMYGMFWGCASLTTLDVSNWDTSNVTDMREMFGGCTSLTTLDVSNWDTSNVTDMSWMFDECASLTTLDVSNWDTSQVTYMNWLFSGCASLTTLDVSNWDTSKVTYMREMFRGCTSLTTLDVSNWDTSKVTDKSNMFSVTRWQDNPPI